MNSREVIRNLERDRQKLVRVTGSHHHFMHPAKPRVTTVPRPRRDIPVGTLRLIAGISTSTRTTWVGV